MKTLDRLRERLAAAAEAFADPESLQDQALAAGEGEKADGLVEPSETSLPPLPEAQDGFRNLVVLVLDSCRFDSFAEAQPKNILRLGELERRWSYASWTSPSHYNLLCGLLPHQSPQNVYASEVYRKEFLRFGERLGTDLEFRQLLPSLWLPHLLRFGLGYRTQALVSLPVLNPATPINRDFDRYCLMDEHNDFEAIIRELRIYVDRPTFALLNLGETHYPYVGKGQDPGELPHLSGLHGVAKRMDDMLASGQGLVAQDEAPAWFDPGTLDRLRARQVDAVRQVDAMMEALYDRVPENTWIVVTADHGELFGEGGYFGHGPIQHDKVFEVPFVEGLLR